MWTKAFPLLACVFLMTQQIPFADLVAATTRQFSYTECASCAESGPPGPSTMMTSVLQCAVKCAPTTTCKAISFANSSSDILCIEHTSVNATKNSGFRIFNKGT